ncbi:unnamed protein product [Pseudo-nitzschia multistriata]|uniref:Uncharacterized protein n=1 Tax=Pseudo-nitzschia multistriata TaxID=183589 RepID=A0A448YYG6_9STRA|nr:unnamed protein product [Pseudo-nitzschia multistriata]
MNYSCKAGVGLRCILVVALSSRTMGFGVVLGRYIKVGSSGPSRISRGVFYVRIIGRIFLEEDRAESRVRESLFECRPVALRGTQKIPDGPSLDDVTGVAMERTPVVESVFDLLEEPIHGMGHLVDGSQFQGDVAAIDFFPLGIRIEPHKHLDLVGPGSVFFQQGPPGHELDVLFHFLSPFLQLCVVRF